MIGVRKIPSLTLRLVLETFRDLAGGQYGLLLERAQLTQYATQLPPADQTPSVTEAEMSTLYATAFELMGEVLTRLYFVNYGQAIAPRVLKSTLGDQMRRRVAGAPPEDKVRVTVKAIGEMVTVALNPMGFSEDAAAYWLTFEHCPFCSKIRGATAPICAGPSTMYSLVASDLFGARLIFTETACVATGGSHCVFSLPKSGRGSARAS